jgi:deoxyribodipyrimidine photolyase
MAANRLHGKTWKEFLSKRFAEYQIDRNYPPKDGTSRKLLYLRFGYISIREMVDNLKNLKNKTEESDGRRGRIGRTTDSIDSNGCTKKSRTESSKEL